MSIETAVYTRLSGFSALTALVGTRIYPVKLPQNPTYPAVTYLKISNIEEEAMGANSGVVRARFQVSAWGGGRDSSGGYLSAKTVATQVKAALRRFRGTVSSVVIQDIFPENETDLYEDDLNVHQIVMDFQVIHEE